MTDIPCKDCSLPVDERGQRCWLPRANGSTYHSIPHTGLCCDCYDQTDNGGNMLDENRARPRPVARKDGER